MQKKLYSNYARHYFRFYAGFPGKTNFRSEADELGYKAADRAFKRLDREERNFLYSLYANRDTLSDAVYEEAKRQGINQDEIWKRIANLESLFADERGLI